MSDSFITDSKTLNVEYVSIDVDKQMLIYFLIEKEATPYWLLFFLIDHCVFLVLGAIASCEFV